MGAYPPGIPVIALGERINGALVDYLEEVVANGGFLERAADPSWPASASWRQMADDER